MPGEGSALVRRARFETGAFQQLFGVRQQDKIGPSPVGAPLASQQIGSRAPVRGGPPRSGQGAHSAGGCCWGDPNDVSHTSNAFPFAASSTTRFSRVAHHVRHDGRHSAGALLCNCSWTASVLVIQARNLFGCANSRRRRQCPRIARFVGRMGGARWNRKKGKSPACRRAGPPGPAASIPPDAIGGDPGLVVARPTRRG
jgi:hypothetical protein